MVEVVFFTPKEVAEIGRETIAKTQRDLAVLENAQRTRETSFTPDEIVVYSALSEQGRKQRNQIDHILP